jgi:hypothetical protein
LKKPNNGWEAKSKKLFTKHLAQFFASLTCSTKIYATSLQLVSALIGILRYQRIIERYVVKPILELGTTLNNLLTMVILLTMGAWRFDGAGVNLVLVISAVAACRHGWRFYKAKMTLTA